MITNVQRELIKQIREEEEQEELSKRYVKEIDGKEYYIVEYEGEKIREPQEVIRVSKGSLAKIEKTINRWRLVNTENMIISNCSLLPSFAIFYFLNLLKAKITLDGVFIIIIVGAVITISYIILRSIIYRKKLKKEIQEALAPYGDYCWKDAGTIQFRGSKYVLLEKE